MASDKFKKPRGTQDILGDIQPAWRQVYDNFTRLCLEAGFERISTPMFEDANLFIRSVGSDTEVVSKEMYVFTDKSDNKLALKPESTAGVVRAYLENHLDNQPKPIKLFYFEPHFRYERPQAGRYRQHHQLGVEVFGVKEAYMDAHVIALAVRLFKSLEIDFKLQVNSIGDKQARVKFQADLVKYFSPYLSELPENATNQLARNPMRLLDSKDEAIVKIAENAPQILDYLDAETKEHFSTVLEYLDDLGIEYDLNPRLVRGFDYYNRTVYEFKGSHVGQQDSIGGGGRYDGLVEELGGQSTGAVGFGLGVERILLELEKSGKLPLSPAPQVYVVGLSDDSRDQVFRLVEKLLDVNISSVSSYAKGSMTGQLAQASRLRAKLCVILGNKELASGNVIVKDMVNGTQEIVPVKDVTIVVANKLS